MKGHFHFAFLMSKVEVLIPVSMHVLMCEVAFLSLVSPCIFPVHLFAMAMSSSVSVNGPGCFRSRGSMQSEHSTCDLQDHLSTTL